MIFKIIKIYNQKSGLFSKGGTSCDLSDDSCWSWGKKGKTWSSEGAVRAHLNLYVNHDWKSRSYDVKIPEHWTVIEVVSDVDTGVCRQYRYSAKEYYEMSPYTVVALDANKN